jgi:hypothetical protein
MLKVTHALGPYILIVSFLMKGLEPNNDVVILYGEG